MHVNSVDTTRQKWVITKLRNAQDKVRGLEMPSVDERFGTILKVIDVVTPTDFKIEDPYKKVDFQKPNKSHSYVSLKDNFVKAIEAEALAVYFKNYSIGHDTPDYLAARLAEMWGGTKEEQKAKANELLVKSREAVKPSAEKILTIAASVRPLREQLQRTGFEFKSRPSKVQQNPIEKAAAEFDDALRQAIDKRVPNVESLNETDRDLYNYNMERLFVGIQMEALGPYSPCYPSLYGPITMGAFASQIVKAWGVPEDEQEITGLQFLAAVREAVRKPANQLIATFAARGVDRSQYQR